MTTPQSFNNLARLIRKEALEQAIAPDNTQPDSPGLRDKYRQLHVSTTDDELNKTKRNKSEAVQEAQRAVRLIEDGPPGQETIDNANGALGKATEALAATHIAARTAQIHANLADAYGANKSSQPTASLAINKAHEAINKALRKIRYAEETYAAGYHRGYEVGYRAHIAKTDSTSLVDRICDLTFAAATDAIRLANESIAAADDALDSPTPEERRSFMSEAMELSNKSYTAASIAQDTAQHAPDTHQGVHDAAARAQEHADRASTNADNLESKT